MIHSTLGITKRTPLAARGMVVAEHPRGAEVGARILERGGNAIDAAVATAFAMTVIEPFMSSIGGSGTMLIHLARRGETVALDFNGVAPRRADATMYRVIGGVSDALFPWPNVEGEANAYGHRSVAVPSVDDRPAATPQGTGRADAARRVATAPHLARLVSPENARLAWPTGSAARIAGIARIPQRARPFLRCHSALASPCGWRASALPRRHRGLRRRPWRPPR